MRKISIAYFFKWSSFSGFFGNLKELCYIPKRLYQRMKYGVSYKDAWNLDAYLAEVIANGCENLKHGMSYPGRDEADTPEKWKAILEELIKIARDYNDEPWNNNNLDIWTKYKNSQITKEEYSDYIINRMKDEQNNSTRFKELLTKWYGDFWD